MSSQSIRVKHRAPRARRFSRCLDILLRPVTLTPVPLADARLAEATALPVVDALPSMDLPAGHMPQRPYDAAPGALAFQPRDRVVVTAEREFCTGRRGSIEQVVSWRPSRQFGVAVEGFPGLSWFDASELAHEPATADDEPTLVIDAVDDLPLMGCARRGAPEVTVHARASRYDGRHGYVVEPDEEGGYEVALPGVPRPVHFEASEVEFAAAGAR